MPRHRPHRHLRPARTAARGCSTSGLSAEAPCALRPTANKHGRAVPASLRKLKQAGQLGRPAGQPMPQHQLQLPGRQQVQALQPSPPLRPRPPQSRCLAVAQRQQHLASWHARWLRLRSQLATRRTHRRRRRCRPLARANVPTHRFSGIQRRGHQSAPPRPCWV